ncbi:MAG: TIGR03905 family TSCPD domain-containing protein [Ruminococcus sp.]|nr:TIGR03905 family TSCPD domain-containing protein [Ruminococcus sp.]
MKTVNYVPKGVCSRQIQFKIDGDVVHDVKYTGGCNGNLQGIAKLVEGMKVDEVIQKLEGINCNGKGTSCPDQLAKALKAYK